MKAAGGKLTKSLPVPVATCEAAGMKARAAVLSKRSPALAFE